MIFYNINITIIKRREKQRLKKKGRARDTFVLEKRIKGLAFS